MMENSIKRNVAPVIRHLYPEEKIESYVEWLCGPKMWEKCLGYVKQNNRYYNTDAFFILSSIFIKKISIKEHI